MTTFLQIHLLVSYPPSNLNRDDMGRPKTATFGGSQRLRISSQALKRAWRTSAQFAAIEAQGNLGKRTKLLGVEVYKEMLDAGISEENAYAWSKEIAGTFAKTKKDNSGKKKDEESDERDLTGLQTEQLVHVSPSERAAILEFITSVLASEDSPDKKTLDKKALAKLLQADTSAADIAMFGRMLADKPHHNVEAAVQVAHAITTHEVEVEEDYFSAVDDLNTEDGGAGHIGEANFAAGVFYIYLNINEDALLANLSGDRALAIQTISALAEACARVTPTGKQNSFAARAQPHYMLVERGNQTPRQLSLAFLEGSPQHNSLEGSVTALTAMRDRMDRAYGAWATSSSAIDLMAGQGSLDEVVRFIEEGFHA